MSAVGLIRDQRPNSSRRAMSAVPPILLHIRMRKRLQMSEYG